MALGTYLLAFVAWVATGLCIWGLLYAKGEREGKSDPVRVETDPNRR